MSHLELSDLATARRRLCLAMPDPMTRLDQDEEWVLVETAPEQWSKIRLHDYAAVYTIQGLYERWVYDVLGCRSPEKVADLLSRGLAAAEVEPRQLCVLDLGAGNGYVAGSLGLLGVERLVGVDIVEEAALAAERDRPGLYEDYVVGDLTDLEEADRQLLESKPFNCLVCVAALGFGDIPVEVFAAAYNLIADGGWVGFTIKEDFVNGEDETGFSALIRRMRRSGALEVEAEEPYTHRISSTGREPLVYVAFIGRKRGDIGAEHLR